MSKFHDNRSIDCIMDSIEDTIRYNIETYKSPFEIDVQRIIEYCRMRKNAIIREFLLGFNNGRDLLIEWHKTLHENCDCEACTSMKNKEEEGQ